MMRFLDVEMWKKEEEKREGNVFMTPSRRHDFFERPGLGLMMAQGANIFNVEVGYYPHPKWIIDSY